MGKRSAKARLPARLPQDADRGPIRRFFAEAGGARDATGSNSMASQLPPAEEGDLPSPVRTPSLPSTEASGDDWTDPPQSSLHTVSHELRYLKNVMAAIPTKLDMEGYVQRLESTYKQELQSLSANLTQVTDRVGQLEEVQRSTGIRQDSQQETLDQHGRHIQALYSMVEDVENRNRRNNIRVRGLPESVQPPDIITTLQGVFNTLLGEPADSDLEIDRAHRSLGPRNPDPSRPRDIICRIHFYTVKEAIMRQARLQQEVLFEGTKLQLLADLSRATLAKRRMLRPLLEVLKEKEISYSWGHPFQLQIKHRGSFFQIRCPEDIPEVITALKLPDIPGLVWPQLPPLPQKLPVRRRRRSSSGNRREEELPVPGPGGQADGRP